MEVIITGKNLEITDWLYERVEEKVITHHPAEHVQQPGSFTVDDRQEDAEGIVGVL